MKAVNWGKTSFGFWVLPAVFTVTLLLSSSLLFMVQPMIGKMVLPYLGGTPQVWNTCMLFFQAVLLLGYLYAHVLGSLRVGWQLSLHLSLLILPIFILPLGFADWAIESIPTLTNPVFWLLGVLFLFVGLPFFVTSASAPLLQRWMSMTDHPTAKDPYYLYAASNVGSMSALVLYPLVIEPRLSLAGQSQLWMWGYWILLLLFVGSAVLLWKSKKVESPRELAQSLGIRDEESFSSAAFLSPDVSWGQRLTWVALAFVPSSLMLGATTFMTTDVAAIPLFWVIPLSLYLLSFIIVFGRYSLLAHIFMSLIGPIFVWMVLSLTFVKVLGSLWMTVALHLGGLFVIAMVCHGELARRRPSARHLTDFFLWMSVGGVLGGMFNALVAPVVFNSILEYPLVLILALILTPTFSLAAKQPRSKLFAASLFVMILFTYYLSSWLRDTTFDFSAWAEFLNLRYHQVVGLVQYALPLLLPLVWLRRPVYAGLSMACIFYLLLQISPYAQVIYQQRSFYGVISVEALEGGAIHSLVHGGTIHGEQKMYPVEERLLARSYYHLKGPIGQIFTLPGHEERFQDVALIGLGTGTLAAYGQKGRRMVFFELDPAMARLAQNRTFFTYLADCWDRGCDLDIVLGDARMQLERRHPEELFDLIVVDAFSSDAIPVHLITLEALELYMSRLREGGMVAFHISNRYLDLEPVLDRLSEELGLAAMIRIDDNEEQIEGLERSSWVVIARSREDLAELVEDLRWYPLVYRPELRVWTDDYSNLLDVMMW